ncbi:MAG: signal recognition particle receptor, partial [Actinomycetota bacterium]
MTTQNLLLILLAVTLVFGFGVVFIGRRSGARTSPKAVVVEPSVAEVLAPVVPVNRWGKTAVALAGILGGVRSRGGITNETWDDLEEALLKADVGIGVTDALLNGLRQRVKSKEI